MILENKKVSDRVRRSINPTNRIIAERARDSSGPIPLYNNSKESGFLYFSIGKKKSDSVSVPSKLLGGKRK